MEELIDKLCAYHHPGVFNPWSEYDVSCDISPDAPAIRCQQLREYLAPRLTRARIVSSPKPPDTRAAASQASPLPANACSWTNTNRYMLTSSWATAASARAGPTATS